MLRRWRHVTYCGLKKHKSKAHKRQPAQYVAQTIKTLQNMQQWHYFEQVIYKTHNLTSTVRCKNSSRVQRTIVYDGLCRHQHASWHLTVANWSYAATRHIRKMDITLSFSKRTFYTKNSKMQYKQWLLNEQKHGALAMWLKTIMWRIYQLI